MGGGALSSNCVSKLESKGVRRNFTLTRISKFTAFTKKFYPLPEVEGKCAFTKPSRGTSEARVEQESTGTLSSRCDCERCRLMRGAVAPKSHKVAFTLAEVLITLGIIGVVAALTLPSVVQNYQKKRTVNKLKSTYTILCNAIEMAKVDYGDDVNQWELPDGNDRKASSDFFAEKYLIPYLKIAKDCNPYVAYACLPTNVSSYRVFILPNGAIIAVFATRSEDLRVQIDMYINGYKKIMNPARDKFTIELGGGDGVPGLDKNKLLPYGYRVGAPRTNYTNVGNMTNCSESGNKTRCFALIVHDGWEISDDYPW